MDNPQQDTLFPLQHSLKWLTMAHEKCLKECLGWNAPHQLIYTCNIPCKCQLNNNRVTFNMCGKNQNWCDENHKHKVS